MDHEPRNAVLRFLEHGVSFIVNFFYGGSIYFEPYDSKMRVKHVLKCTSYYFLTPLCVALRVNKSKHFRVTKGNIPHESSMRETAIPYERSMLLFGKTP